MVDTIISKALDGNGMEHVSTCRNARNSALAVYYSHGEFTRGINGVNLSLVPGLVVSNTHLNASRNVTKSSVSSTFYDWEYAELATVLYAYLIPKCSQNPHLWATAEKCSRVCCPSEMSKFILIKIQLYANILRPW